LNRPIGVFDSGIGGLSVLRALRAELPHQDFVYIADSAHAPYGERDDAHVLARSRAITHYLRQKHGVQLLVVACNTATAIAIDTLRAENPGFVIVGVEPAIKPAAALTKTGRVGVMATRRTLGSARFRALLDARGGSIKWVCQPCDGLADAIEDSVHSQDTTNLIAICAYNTGAIGQFGTEIGQIDTLVLGCTHYPFAQTQLRDLLGPNIQFVATGEPVARQTQRLLAAANPQQETSTRQMDQPGQGQVQLVATGRPKHLEMAAAQWLQWHGQINLLSIT
jgi:glutamate racemase